MNNRVFFIRWYNEASKIWVLVQHEYYDLQECNVAAKNLGAYFNTKTDILCKVAA